jgi:hypothetical protein
MKAPVKASNAEAYHCDALVVPSSLRQTLQHLSWLSRSLTKYYIHLSLRWGPRIKSIVRRTLKDANNTRWALWVTNSPHYTGRVVLQIPVLPYLFLRLALSDNPTKHPVPGKGWDLSLHNKTSRPNPTQLLSLRFSLDALNWVEF